MCFIELAFGFGFIQPVSGFILTTHQVPRGWQTNVEEEQNAFHHIQSHDK